MKSATARGSEWVRRSGVRGGTTLTNSGAQHKRSCSLCRHLLTCWPKVVWQGSRSSATRAKSLEALSTKTRIPRAPVYTIIVVQIHLHLWCIIVQFSHFNSPKKTKKYNEAQNAKHKKRTEGSITKLQNCKIATRYAIRTT